MERAPQSLEQLQNRAQKIESALGKVEKTSKDLGGGRWSSTF